MKISKNISVSLVFHILFIGAAVIFGSSTSFIKKDVLSVSLLSDNAAIEMQALKSSVPNNPSGPFRNKKTGDEILNNNKSKYDDIISSDTAENAVITGYETRETSAVPERPDKGTSPLLSLNVERPGEKIPGVITATSQPAIFNNKSNSWDYASALPIIRTAIQKNLVYPYIAIKKRIEGTVIAEFSINQNGDPENISILKSSGHEILDKAAKDSIKKASPFPFVSRSVEIPVTFRITKG